MNGIADYEFIRSLGKGNHGEFFVARTPARLPVDAELVAVKVLAGPTSEDIFRRATRELSPSPPYSRRTSSPSTTQASRARPSTTRWSTCPTVRWAMAHTTARR